MSTLTYTNRNLCSGSARDREGPAQVVLARGFGHALIESQQRRADREIARFLASHGGLLTDEMEREIMRRVTRSDRRAL